MGTLDFSELLAAASCGERAAQSELHRRYVPFVRHHLRRRAGQGLRRSHDTADLAQSVFVEVLRDLRRFEDRGERAFRRWLSIKAGMKFRKQMHRTGGLRETPLEGESPRLDRGPGPVTYINREEDAVRLSRAMERIKPVYRELLHLRRSGMTYDGIAAVLGLSTPDAARMKHARALLALRRQWKTP